MKRRIALLLSFALLAACARPQGAVTIGGRHAWTTPHVLRVADISDPDTLNPYLSTMDLSYFLTSLMYSYLVISDGSGHLIGDLATKVPTLANGGVSSDGTTYTYHLRHGVRWQDGARFTSRDVLASWRAVTDPHNNTLHREGYDRVASISLPDDYTVVVHLRRRYPPFVTQFFAPLQEGGKPILPAHVLARENNFNSGELNAHPIGTGPFTFVKWDRGNDIVLHRFDGYFKGRPKLERITLSIVSNDQTILNEMATHQIDLVLSPPSSLADQYRRLLGVETALYPWNAQSVVIFNARRPGLHDVVVRRAIASAIDYDALIAKDTHGVGEVSYNSLPATAIGYERLAPHRYDPTAANQALDAAGWKLGADGVRAKNDVSLSFVYASISGSSGGKILALQLQAYLKAIGVALEIKSYPYDQLFAVDGPIYGNKYDITAYSTTIAWDPDVHVYLGCNQWYPRGENVYGYCNPQLDALEARGLQSDNSSVRVASYRAASKIIWADVPYLPLYNLRRFVVRSADIRNFTPNPTATAWWNAYQWDI